MIVKRNVYEAVLHISRAPTQYDPDNPEHATALEAGVAEINGKLIELTFKGELVRDL